MGLDHGIRIKPLHDFLVGDKDDLIYWRKRFHIHEFFVRRARRKNLTLWNYGSSEGITEFYLDKDDLIALLVEYHQFEKCFGFPFEVWYEDSEFLKQEIEKVVKCIELLKDGNNLYYYVSG